MSMKCVIFFPTAVDFRSSRAIGAKECSCGWIWTSFKSSKDAASVNGFCIIRSALNRLDEILLSANRRNPSLWIKLESKSSSSKNGKRRNSMDKWRMSWSTNWLPLSTNRLSVVFRRRGCHPSNSCSIGRPLVAVLTLWWCKSKDSSWQFGWDKRCTTPWIPKLRHWLPNKRSVFKEGWDVRLSRILAMASSDNPQLKSASSRSVLLFEKPSKRQRNAPSSRKRIRDRHNCWSWEEEGGDLEPPRWLLLLLLLLIQGVVFCKRVWSASASSLDIVKSLNWSLVK